jgi:hypothetical protein
MFVFSLFKLLHKIYFKKYISFLTGFPFHAIETGIINKLCRF